MEHLYEIVRNAVPLEVTNDALRVINRAFLHGIKGDEVEQYLREQNWFYWLRDAPEIKALAEYIPDRLKTKTLCEPQIVLGFPVGKAERVRLSFHTDVEPEWAGARRYYSIVGVMLTRAYELDGAPILLTDRGRVYNEFNQGDILAMRPELKHSPGINKGGSIRYAVYFRYLKD